MMREISTPELMVVRDALPVDTLEDLHHLAHSQPVRKRYIDLAVDCPDEVMGAALSIAGLLHTRMNTAILKRYRLDDNPPSGAYEPHPDPGCYAGEKISLFSLDGEAALFVEDDEGVQEVECYENTLVAMNPSLRHWVTTPLNPEGVRHLLFLGLDNTRPATIDSQ